MNGEDGLDVGQHAALSDGHSAQQLVELLVVADGQLQVAGDDAGLLVVAGGVSGELQDLSGQVLEHSRQVDGSSGTDALSVVPLAEESVDTADGELEPGTGRAGLGLGPGFASGLASSRHLSLYSCCTKYELEARVSLDRWLRCRRAVYLELVYLVTALVPSDTACLASSPGSSRRTAVWISREVMVERLLREASPAMRSKMSLTKEFMMPMALEEMPVSGCTCFSTLYT
ncbi:hypothetical protein CRUP_024807 [Coryphaenoides rupestris]|nr:hypothetical protein CRUP_024807 [Coryphaenoides rupestris]